MSSTHPFPAIPAATPSPRPGTGAVLTRSIVVGVVGLGVALLVDRLDPTVDANIGAGLLGLAAVLLVTTGWGFVDGRRTAGSRPYLLWLAVAVVATMGTALVAGAGAMLAGGVGPDAIAGFVIMCVVAASGSIPFVLAPAAVGILVGQLLARRSA